MNTTLLHQSPSDIATPLLVVFAADTATTKDAPAAPTLLTTSVVIEAAATPWLTSGDFKATLGETFLLPAPAGLKAQRLLLIGLGKADKLTPHELRKAAGGRFARNSSDGGVAARSEPDQHDARILRQRAGELDRGMARIQSRHRAEHG